MDIQLLILLLTIIIAGGFGGLLDFCNKFTVYSEDNAKENIFKNGRVLKNRLSDDKKNQDEKDYFGYFYLGAAIRRRHLAWIAFFQMLLGVGGALAVAFFLIPLKQFPYTVSNENIIFLFTLGVVAGFGGNRFLEKVRGQLESQIADTQHDVSQTKKQVSKLQNSLSSIKKDMDYDLEASDTLNQAHAILENPDPNAQKSMKEIEQTSLDLENMVKHHKHFSRVILRRATIYLGRIYRHKYKDVERATEHLTKFITKFGDVKDEHLASVLFNRACYYSLQAVASSIPKEQSYFEKADNDIQAAINIDNSVEVDLHGDENVKADPDLVPYIAWLNNK